MASTTEIQGPQVRSADSTLRMKAAAIPAIFALAQTPLLWLYIPVLLGREHYHFFPLLLLGVAVLLWQRWPRDAKAHAPESYRAANAMLLLSLLVLAYGTLLFSWFFAAIALVLTIGALIRRFAGADAARQLLPVWLLLLLVVPPPLKIDYRLITWLQTFTSASSSLVLEALGINHLMLGNLLELPGRVLMVEQACSGIQSLFALFSFTALFVVWNSRPLIHSLLLLVTAVFWAGLGNVSRVVTIALAHQQSGVDLSTGWQHQVLGLVEFSVALILVFSTDQLLQFLLAPLGQLSPIESEQSPFSRLWNRLFQNRTEAVGANEPVGAPTGATAGLPSSASVGSPRRFAVWDACGSWPVAVVFVTLGTIQLATLLADRSPVLSSDRAAVTIDESTFPAETQDWTKVDFRVTQRESSSSWGEFSKTWTYASDIGPAFVSCDYPFRDWHELGSCYRGHGWEVTKREIVTWSEPVGTKVVQIQMRRPTGEHGYLLFGLFDATGRDLTPEGSNTWIVTRLIAR